MKHLFASALAFLWALCAFAQSVPGHRNSVSLALQGGAALDIYENAFTYRENGVSADLITVQGAFSLGYDFTEAFAIRGQMAFGTDAGGANVRQTAGGGFYPYSFKHANMFLDFILNLSGFDGRSLAFRPKLYAGLGGAHTFGFSNPGHPWQKITDPNTVFGFRGGFLAEYTTPSGFGFFADLCGEAYGDMYSGLMPSAEDQKRYEGYGGFPFDVRFVLSLGMIFYL